MEKNEIRKLQKWEKNGNWVEFHENGKIKSKGNYKNGIQEDLWEEYFKGGQLKSKEILKEKKRVLGKFIILVKI